ncbi:MAG TPA: hypothetical protein PKA03_06140 [Tabrizicola sp.]|nr:hypothetical protein [Tabrizicola sp.]
MKQIRPTTSDMETWASNLSKFPLRQSTGLGSGSVGIGERLNQIGQLTGEIDAQVSDLFHLSEHMPEQFRPDSEIAGWASGAGQKNLYLQAAKLKKGLLVGKLAWLLKLTLSFDERDDVFGFGYIAAPNLTELFDRLISARAGNVKLRMQPEAALAGAWG